jgi:hypothetical protein
MKRKHNPQTRGLIKYGREPLGWNPENLEKQNLSEPLNELKLDWVREISFYAAENRLRASKNARPDGQWDYTLEDRYGNHYLTVTSPQDLMVATKRKKEEE